MSVTDTDISTDSGSTHEVDSNSGKVNGKNERNQITEGLEFMEPMTLYNMLQQGVHYSALCDTNNLILIDARKRSEYNESHIITAKYAPRNSANAFMIPYDAELECKKNIVVYDGSTSDLRETTPANVCGKVYWDVGSRETVKILRGGYEEFSALYPFLRTQKILYTPREVEDLASYPKEIIQGVLYLGNWRQGNSQQVQKDLKIRGHINCTTEACSSWMEPGPHLLHVAVNDDNDSKIYEYFRDACVFTDYHFEELFPVLVFDKLNISRAVTIVVAILMHTNKWTLERSYKHVKECCASMRPNRAFVEQLSTWEQDIFSERITDISDPKF